MRITALKDSDGDYWIRHVDDRYSCLLAGGPSTAAGHVDGVSLSGPDLHRHYADLTPVWLDVTETPVGESEHP